MFDFLFDCSALEVSAQVSAINSILFPVFLFAVTFWLMYQIFIDESVSKFPEAEINGVGDLIGNSPVMQQLLSKNSEFMDGIKPFQIENKNTEFFHIG